MPTSSRFLFVLFLTIFSQKNVFSQQKHPFSCPKMGSPFNITVSAKDTIGLAAAIEKCYARVDTLNQIFSDYSATSELSVLCKNAKTNVFQPISNDFLYILKKSEEAYRLSGGAYDVTVGNIVRLWRRAKKEKRLPDASELNQAKRKTGFFHLKTSINEPKMALDTEGVLLDFGGIVKGYAAQEAVDILKKNGFPNCLADAGGDLALGDMPLVKDTSERKMGWQIAVSVPQNETELMPQMLNLKNQAVATSGDMYNFLEINGLRYSHIVDPKTGLGLTHQRNVTIIAPDGATADWLATACSVLSIKKAMRLIRKISGAELLILENRKGKIKMWQSKGFAQFFNVN